MHEPTSNKSKGVARVERLLMAAFVLSVAALLFIGGAFVTAAGVTPGPQIARAYAGGKALVEQLTRYDDVFLSDLWHPARTQAREVTLHRPGRPSPGATLYTSGDQAAAYLIDLNGKLLFQWRKPYSEVWQPGGSVKRPQPDSHVYFRKAVPQRDGSLIALYEGVGDTPYGYGMVKLDRDSRLVWRFLENTHHDFSIAPDGRIAVLTHRIVDRAEKDYPKLASPRLDDFIAVLSPDGRKLQEIELLPLVQNSPYRHLLHTVSAYATGGPLHANTVRYISDDEAKNFPYGRAGQLLVSFRELGAIGVVDPQEGKLVWAARAYWIGQHDPHILANGRVLLFDNYGNFDMPNGRSRVIEFDPRSMAIAWQYGGSPERPLDSDVRSQVQRLANGNTLITESSGGRMLEVAPDGDVVWEFVNPVRGGKDGRLIPIIGNAQRLEADATPWLYGNPQRYVRHNSEVFR